MNKADLTDNVGDSAELLETIQNASAEFDKMCTERHERGAQKYGELGFLENDTLTMAIEEVIDLANYARYTYIRIRLIQQRLEASNQTPGSFSPARGE